MAEETTEQQSTWLTHDAFDRLTEELRRRKDTDRKEIAARVEAARQEATCARTRVITLHARRPDSTRLASFSSPSCLSTPRSARPPLTAQCPPERS